MLKLVFKMKNILNFIALLFSALILFSCEPGRDENGDLLFGLDDPKPIEELLLKKMTSTNSDDEISTFVYNYSGKQLTSVNIDEDGLTSDILLTYDKGKISKLVMTELDGSNMVSTMIDLIYTNGLLTSSNGKMESGGVEIFKTDTNFLYNGATLKKIETIISQKNLEDSTTHVEAFKTVSDVIFEGRNLSNWKMTVTTKSPSPIIIPPVVVEVKMSNYDAFKNPLGTLPKEFNIAGAHLLSGTNSIQGLSVNNYKTATIKADGTATEVNYIYEYNATGYPIKATSDQGTLTFEYQ